MNACNFNISSKTRDNSFGLANFNDLAKLLKRSSESIHKRPYDTLGTFSDTFATDLKDKHNSLKTFDYSLGPTVTQGNYITINPNRKFYKNYQKVFNEIKEGNTHPQFQNQYIYSKKSPLSHSDQRIKLQPFKNESNKNEKYKCFAEKLNETKYNLLTRGEVHSNKIGKNFSDFLKKIEPPLNDKLKKKRKETVKTGEDDTRMKTISYLSQESDYIHKTDHRFWELSSPSTSKKTATTGWNSVEFSKTLSIYDNKESPKKKSTLKKELLFLLNDGEQESSARESNLLKKKICTNDSMNKGSYDEIPSKKTFDMNKYPLEITRKMKKKFPDLIKSDSKSFCNCPSKCDNTRIRKMKSQIEKMFA